MIRNEFKSDDLSVFIERLTRPVSTFEIRKFNRPIYFESIISANEKD